MTPKGLTPDELRRAQALIERIQGVSSCRIAATGAGEITEVHVVATTSKSPKLIARDVESCLKAEMGVDVDYKKIGVVMFDEDASADDSAAAEEIAEFPVEEFSTRFAFNSVNVFSTKQGVKAEVELSRDGMDAFGTADSSNVALTPWRVIAEATLAAVSEFLDESISLCLVEVLKVPLGDQQAVVARIDLVGQPGIKILAGCSIISRNENQSVVYATLDAVNRVIGKLDFKSSVEFKIR